ncbi:MAG: hypothetical protein H0V17_04850 [Deltaproteobacteria bacterium]|nr:hypothetical protein [Deltaproteobacteria bacterium]
MRCELWLVEPPALYPRLLVAGAEPAVRELSRLLQARHRLRSEGKPQLPLPAAGLFESIGLDAGPDLRFAAEQPRYRTWRLWLTMDAIDPEAVHELRNRSADLVLVAGTTTDAGLDQARHWGERLQREVGAAREADSFKLPRVPFAFVLDDTTPGARPRPAELAGHPVHALSADGVTTAYQANLAAVRTMVSDAADSLLARVPGGAARLHATAFHSDPVARSLHQAIVDEPFRDGPRHALADLLHARGDDRGEFITLQLRLASETRHGTRSAESSIRERARALLKQHAAAWTQDLAQWCANQQFGRGFVESIVVSPAQWLFGHQEISRRAPVIGLRLDSADGFAELVAHASLSRIVALSVAGMPIADAGACALAASPHVRQLRYLDLERCAIGREGCDAIETSSNLTGLRWSSLTGNAIEPRNVAARPQLAALLPVED